MRFISVLLLIGLAFVASQEATEPQPVKPALLVLDTQYCTLPGGAAAISGGDGVVSAVNDIRTLYDSKFAKVVLTQEWKCATHVSFASMHVGHNSGEVLDLHYNAAGQLCATEITNTDYTVPCPDSDPASRGKQVKQRLYEDSCLSYDAESDFSSLMIWKPSDKIIRKSECDVATDSAFRDNIHRNMTGLEAILEAADVNTLLITGVGKDNIFATASDAKLFSYNTYVITDATAGLDAAQATALEESGVMLISSADIPTALGLVAPEAKASARVSVVIIVVLASLISLATIVAWASYVKYFRTKKRGNFKKVVVADQQSEPIVPSDDEDDNEDDSDDDDSDEEEEAAVQTTAGVSLDQTETAGGDGEEEKDKSSSSSSSDEAELES